MVLEAASLPKRSENFIAVYIDGCRPAETTFILEDNSQPSDSLYAVVRCTSTFENGECPIILHYDIAKEVDLSNSDLIK